MSRVQVTRGREKQHGCRRCPIALQRSRRSRRLSQTDHDMDSYGVSSSTPWSALANMIVTHITYAGHQPALAFPQLISGRDLLQENVMSFFKGTLLAACLLASVLAIGPTSPVHAEAAEKPANVGNPVGLTGPEQRVALVIGNSTYQNVTQLPNPANDA